MAGGCTQTAGSPGQLRIAAEGAGQLEWSGLARAQDGETNRIPGSAKFPEDSLIRRVLHGASVECHHPVPGSQSRALRRTSRFHAGHDIGAQRRLVREIDSEFHGGGPIESGSGHPEIGIEQSGGRENDRQRSQRDVKPARSAAVGRR